MNPKTDEWIAAEAKKWLVDADMAPADVAQILGVPLERLREVVEKDPSAFIPPPIDVGFLFRRPRA